MHMAKCLAPSGHIGAEEAHRGREVKWLMSRRRWRNAMAASIRYHPPRREGRAHDPIAVREAALFRRVHSRELSSVGHPYQLRNYAEAMLGPKPVRVNELIARVSHLPLFWQIPFKRHFPSNRYHPQHRLLPSEGVDAAQEVGHASEATSVMDCRPRIRPDRVNGLSDLVWRHDAPERALLATLPTILRTRSAASAAARTRQPGRP